MSRTTPLTGPGSDGRSRSRPPGARRTSDHEPERQRQGAETPSEAAAPALRTVSASGRFLDHRQTLSRQPPAATEHQVHCRSGTLSPGHSRATDGPSVWNPQCARFQTNEQRIQSDQALRGSRRALPINADPRRFRRSERLVMVGPVRCLSVCSCPCGLLPSFSPRAGGKADGLLSGEARHPAHRAIR